MAYHIQRIKIRLLNAFVLLVLIIIIPETIQLQFSYTSPARLYSVLAVQIKKKTTSSVSV